MIADFYKTNTRDFFKEIAKEIQKRTSWTPSLQVQNHSQVDVTYLGLFEFKDCDGIVRYLNLICLFEKGLYLVNKYYLQRDWAYLNEEERMRWRGKTQLLPIDMYMFSVTDISSIDIAELINLVSINKKFENLNEESKKEENVYSYIDNFFTIKQQREMVEKRIKEYEEQLEELKKQTVVSTILIPLAAQCKEYMHADKYRLLKNETEQGVRINIVVETNGTQKRLPLLVKGGYPFEVTGLTDDKTFQVSHLPRRFEELITHFK